MKTDWASKELNHAVTLPMLQCFHLVPVRKNTTVTCVRAHSAEQFAKAWPNMRGLGTARVRTVVTVH